MGFLFFPVISGMKVLCLLFVIAFSLSVSATCWGGRPSENSTVTAMATCCWLSDDTCCSAEGTTAELSDIQVSLSSLVERGLSEECYFALSNLECSLCSPNQHEYITYGGPIDGDDTDDDFDNQRWIFRICTDFCHALYKKCKNPTDTALLAANNQGTEVDFCESISGESLVADDEGVTSIFGGATWVVSNFNCYQGSTEAIIQENTGVCLTDYNEIVTLANEQESSSPASILVSLFGVIGSLLLALF